MSLPEATIIGDRMVYFVLRAPALPPELPPEMVAPA